MSEYDLIISGLLQEISFVPRGANGKEYLLTKEHKMKGDILKSIAETPDEELLKILNGEKLEKESLEVLEVVGSLLKSYKDKLPEGSLSILAKACGYPEPKPKEGKGGKNDSTDDGQDDNNGDNNYGFSKGQLEKMDPGTRDLITKMMGRIDASDKRAEKAEILAKQLEERRLNKEYAEKVKVLKHIPGLVSEKHGPIMKALGEAEPEAFKEFYDILKAADALLEKSALWGEIGSGLEGKGGAASGKLDKIARGLVAKDADLSYEDALEKACELHPELAAEALDEGASAGGV